MKNVRAVSRATQAADTDVTSVRRFMVPPIRPGKPQVLAASGETLMPVNRLIGKLPYYPASRNYASRCEGGTTGKPVPHVDDNRPTRDPYGRLDRGPGPPGQRADFRTRARRA